MEKHNLLVKIGKAKHLHDIRNGIIYCNTLKYFCELDSENNGMSDKFEGANYIRQFETLSKYINGKWVPILKNGTATTFSEKYNGNLFCAYYMELYLNVKTGAFDPVDLTEYLSDFPEADSYIIILNINEFSKRFDKKVRENNDLLHFSKVKYLNYKDSNQEINPFIKDIRFKNQNEFRYYIERDAKNKNDVQIYNIGDLKDIITEVSDINQLKNLSL